MGNVFIKLDFYKLKRIYEIYGGEEEWFEYFLLTLCNEGVFSVKEWDKFLKYYKKYKEEQNA